MIDELKPYPALKDSGVPWLGKVPEHWDVRSFRAVASARKGRQPQTLSNAETASSNALPYLSMNYLRSSNNTSKEYAEPQVGLVAAKVDDTILLWDGTNAGEFFRAKEGIVSSTAAQVESHELDRRYFFLACKICEPTLRALTIGMGIPHVDGNVLKGICFPLPSRSEQATIVRFIDHAGGRIQRYIRAKQKLIKALEEMRQAIIYRAVAQGLDPNAARKSTNIEWLPSIPTHWSIRKLGLLARVFNGSTPSRMQAAYWANGTITWLSSGKVNDYFIDTASELITERAYKECSVSLVPKGSVVLGLVGQGKTRGMSALLNIDACINQNLAAIVPGSELDGRYLHHFFTAFYKTVRELGRGGNQEALNCDIVSKIKIPLPPLDEQRAMCDAIRSDSDRINTVLARMNREVALVRELRTTLMSDVVTGKLDVREAAALLPQEAAEAEPLDEIDDLPQDESAAEDAELEAADAP